MFYLSGYFFHTFIADLISVRHNKALDVSFIQKRDCLQIVTYSIEFRTLVFPMFCLFSELFQYPGIQYDKGIRLCFLLHPLRNVLLFSPVNTPADLTSAAFQRLRQSADLRLYSLGHFPVGYDSDLLLFCFQLFSQLSSDFPMIRLDRGTCSFSFFYRQTVCDQ